ncbi:ABC transporter permease [Mycetocola reblochoni]|uniref:Thiamin ABC transporter, transmembrane component n=2 Tax=Mycetocola reblochoni TaxID=331618 RepID=A0A1R4I713_9MICO|nr:ABC transporter permease subunit [Mycetocola reblochoni]RLP68212.1 ABC transporter permease subunit [Mycetocola reblochoni]SJN15404.1 Thiamin ABC transporter, transmembrane component [Mycetocola reblochoni REB411]
MAVTSPAPVAPAVPSGARPRRRTAGPSRPAPRTATAVITLSLIAAAFAIPLISMLEFSLRTADGHGLDHWIALFSPETAGRYSVIWTGLGNSLILALVTVAIVLLLLAPTMLLVTLRFPRLRRTMELLCLLPLSLPAIVLVVGLVPIYLGIGRSLGTGAWTLAFAYGVTVIPYAYRAIQSNIDAVDVVTLSEAARTLGAGWLSVVLRVLVPNLRRGLLAACLISVAVVLGEFTIASLLNRSTLQTALFVVNKQDPYAAVILSLLSLAFAYVLLVLIGRVGGPRRGPRRRRDRATS